MTNTSKLPFAEILKEVIKDKNLCKVRTVTTFINLTPDMGTWYEVLTDAFKHCQEVSEDFLRQAYTVQSIRIVTNPFGEYLDTTNIQSAKIGLDKITQLLDKLNHSENAESIDNAESNSSQSLRIRFAIGEAKTVQEIKLLPELIAQYGDLCNACVNVPVNDLGILDNELIEHCVDTIQCIATTTPRGEGNFNFTVNFNCNEFIPYFPASYHSGLAEKGFVIGLETPDLLVTTLKTINGYLSKTSLDITFNYQQHCRIAFGAMSYVLQYHIDTINQIAYSKSIEADSQCAWKYLGIDTSVAPSKDCASMVEVYKLLGVPYFGASGTVEASSLLTRVFKSIKGIKAVGFSGLMLAVTEDTGLAQGTINKDYDIRALLTYSAVCGIGLDTVPIEGNTSKHKLAALMRDTGTMAFRLNKPLTVRVFPVPNLSAGEITQFESDDLCNCALMSVP